jgi:hypothetical protein
MIAFYGQKLRHFFAKMPGFASWATKFKTVTQR